MTRDRVSRLRDMAKMGNNVARVAAGGVELLCGHHTTSQPVWMKRGRGTYRCPHGCGLQESKRR